MNMWLPTAPCTMEACVSKAIRPANLLVRFLRLLGAAVLALVGLPVAGIAALTGTGYRAVSHLSRAMLKVLGIRLSVVDMRTAPATQGELLVVNHISWLDPLAVAAALPCELLAKSEVGGWPLISTVARSSGTIFIDRSRPFTLPATVREIADSLQAGRTVAAFPEGTTWCGRSRGPFRPAVFQAAIDANVPVVPVALSFFEDGKPSSLAAFVGDTTLLRSLFKVVTARELVIGLTFLPQILPTADRRTLAAAAEAAISSELIQQTGGTEADHISLLPPPVFAISTADQSPLPAA